jgi:transposase-like protein
MSKSIRYTSEQSLQILGGVEHAIRNGETIRGACRLAGIAQETYHRWRRGREGVHTDQILKKLQKENADLRRLVLKLSLEKQTLLDITSNHLRLSMPGTPKQASSQTDLENKKRQNSEPEY